MILHLHRQAIWGLIWKYKGEVSQTNATSVTRHLPKQAVWGLIWKDTVEKSQTNATSVIIVVDFYYVLCWILIILALVGGRPCPCHSCDRVPPCSVLWWGTKSERIGRMASLSFLERRLLCVIFLYEFSNHFQFWNSNHTGQSSKVDLNSAPRSQIIVDPNQVSRHACKGHLYSWSTCHFGTGLQKSFELDHHD